MSVLSSLCRNSWFLLSAMLLGVLPALAQSTTTGSSGATDMPTLISSTSTDLRAQIFPVVGAAFTIAGLLWAAKMLWNWMKNAMRTR